MTDHKIYPNTYCNRTYSLDSEKLTEEQANGLKRFVPNGFDDSIICAGMYISTRVALETRLGTDYTVC